MDRVKLKNWLKENAGIRVVAIEEDASVQESFRSGDPALDKQAQDDILERMQVSEWAWCCVKVGARYEDWRGYAYLGCCSYDSEEDFIKNSGHYEELVDEALDELVDNILETRKKMKKIWEEIQYP